MQQHPGSGGSGGLVFVFSSERGAYLESVERSDGGQSPTQEESERGEGTWMERLQQRIVVEGS